MKEEEEEIKRVLDSVFVESERGRKKKKGKSF